MRLWIALSTALIAYFTYGFYISQYEVSVVTDRLEKENPPGFYDYRGVINVHTDLSIGSSPPQQVIQAARNVGLDFLMLTDLNQFTPMSGFEGYQGNTLVMAGVKISYLDSRLIYYSTKSSLPADNLGDSQIQLADLMSQRAEANPETLLILAHPYKAGFSWGGQIPTGLDGLEILNTKSLSNRTWEKSKASTIWSLLTYPFNPRLAFLRLFAEPIEEIDLFDSIGRQRKFIGFAGAEASARAIPLANYLIKFPSYQRSFEFVTNHVLLTSELTGHPSNDRQKIFQALKKGQFYTSLDLIGDPKGFNAYLEDRGRIFPLGSTVKLNPTTRLHVRLGSTPNSFYEIVIFKDGARFSTFNVPEVEMKMTEPGSYRVQVRVSPYLPLPDAKRWITWIYSNHLHVR